MRSWWLRIRRSKQGKLPRVLGLLTDKGGVGNYSATG